LFAGTVRTRRAKWDITPGLDDMTHTPEAIGVALELPLML
jgi:hypothetical protein